MLSMSTGLRRENRAGVLGRTTGEREGVRQSQTWKRNEMGVVKEEERAKKGLQTEQCSATKNARVQKEIWEGRID